MRRAAGWLSVSIALFLAATTIVRAAETATDVILAVHGGAGGMPKLTADEEREYRQALENALKAGYARLQSPEGTSLDAVEAAVKVLEDSPYFNAGKGAVFTYDGRNEMDASIMDGATKKAGAVAGVTTIKNPIVAARAVMDKTWHVLLAGQAADDFARENRLEIVDPSYFRTERRWKEREDLLKKEREAKDTPAPGKCAFEPAQGADGENHLGTVGAVALDRHGNLAAATSTGGLVMKRHGRVGDSPIIGAGTYADNKTCAVSGTGQGEYFMRGVAAYDVCALMEYKGMTVADAAGLVVHHKLKDAGGKAGMIALDAKGILATPFNTEGMSRGFITKDGKTVVKLKSDEPNKAK